MFFGLNDVGFLGSLQPPLTLLLDLYPNAAAAYSLRQLRTGVTNVVRVRRSSDNTEADFTAAQVSNGSLAAWVGAGNNGFVQTWYDQSGNGIHAVQVTTDLQPKIVDASAGLFTVDSKPALSISSGDTLTFSTSNFANTFLDITSVASVLSYSNFGAMLLGSQTTANTYWQFGAGATFYAQGSQSPGGTGVSIADSTRRLLNLHTTSTAEFARYSGVQYTRSITISAIPSGSRSYTLFTYSFGLSWNWRGTAQEVVIYPSIQTSNRSGIESNINAHYAIY
jgi:hypothetical protein